MNSRQWKHESVVRVVGRADPVAFVTALARQLVTKAFDDGWSGPPFDPFALADLLGLELQTNTGIRDARLLIANDKPRIEFNPERPRGRLRYSIAHEIAHTLFPDWHEAVRNRLQTGEGPSSESELETLCNIAAAEILMPFGSVAELRNEDISIETLLKHQREFDVSTEALFLRAVQVSEHPCAMLVARSLDNDQWAVEYSVASSNFAFPAGRGDSIPTESIVTRLRGIGHTLKALEQWPGLDGSLRVETVGIPGYPGSPYPRVVAWVRPAEDSSDQVAEWISYVLGDATMPTTPGSKIIVQIVSDKAITWGGGGFAAAVRRRYPPVQEAFRDWVLSGGGLKLGRVHVADAAADLKVASVVAQHGFGASATPRIRYQALFDGLTNVATLAKTEGATLHMPRIGVGQAGGAWDRIEELLSTAFRDLGLTVTVYDLPHSNAASRHVRR